METVITEISKHKEDIGSIDQLLDEISIRITGLVEIDDNFDYSNLIEFKRNVLEKKAIDNLNSFNENLTDKQKKILEDYKEERISSVLYGSPLNETDEEKVRLKIGEELYIIIEKINTILI